MEAGHAFSNHPTSPARFKAITLQLPNKKGEHLRMLAQVHTLPETNMAPENGWLFGNVWNTSFLFWDGLFSRAMLISGSVDVSDEMSCIHGERLVVNHVFPYVLI